MSKVTITLYNVKEREDVAFEGATVPEVLSMKAEYLLTMGEGSRTQTTSTGGADFGGSDAGPPPSDVKPSGFLSKVKGGE